MSERTIYPFAEPDNKYTMFDNYILDFLMPLVKPNAWKILCLIIRKTRGWHKPSDKISFSQIKALTGISSDETVNNALKQLVASGYILAKKGDLWSATEYAINTAYSVTTEIEVEPATEIEDTKETVKETIKDKKLSANADHSRPVSLLSENEIRELKLPFSEWTQFLADEVAERGRSGVVKFIKAKLAIFPLLPDTPQAHVLFEKLAIEYEAKGRRPPVAFPTLAAKAKFDQAVADLNGTVEVAIAKALESGITAIPKIINYISSPKWRETNGQKPTRTGQSEIDGHAPSETRADAYLRRNKTNIDAWEEKMFG